MRNEFALIDAITRGLGDRAAGEWISLGPGDDAAVISTTPNFAQIASIDTLLPDVHFPAEAPPELIGYRALMVSFSDLAAMRGVPRYCLVSLSMDESQGAAWVASLACGMPDAARERAPAQRQRAKPGHQRAGGGAGQRQRRQRPEQRAGLDHPRGPRWPLH